MNYNKENITSKKNGVSSKKTKKTKKRGVRILKIVLLAVLILLLACGAAAGIYLKGIIDSTPDISTINVAPSQLATTVYAADGSEITKLVRSGSNREYADISQIPDCVEKAFIAIEDERFYSHNGIDIPGIIRAFFVGLSQMSFSEGASTITQQLIKNNVLTTWTEETTFQERLNRKIQEQYLAIQIEKQLSKDTILEYYLNTINLGQNCLGVQTASKRYFDKDVSELTISEAAVIAAITQNPTKYNPITRPDDNKTRREKVLNTMYKLGFITQDELNDALADDVYSRVRTVSTANNNLSTTSYFVDELIDQVAKTLCEEKGYTETQAYNAIYSGGLQIYSTQDLEIQKICDEEANNDDNYPAKTEYDLSYRLTVKKANGSIVSYSENDMSKYFKEINGKYSTIYADKEDAAADILLFKEHVLDAGDTIPEGGEVIYYVIQPQTSITVMDQSTGEIKAIVGGRGEKVGNMTLNRATQTTRQPGSCFKVLAAFAPALDTAGMTLATTIIDEPFSYSNGRPVHNWWGDSYRGACTIREAITQSMNIIAVKTITEITPQLGFDYLLNFGFTSLVDHRTLDDGTVISDIGQPTALGGISLGVKNYELTAAYATIANGGTYTEPIFFTKILDSKGNVLINNTPKTKRVLKEETAYLLTNAMQDVITRGTGGRAYFDGMPIAGKTGTTSDDYDIWLSAYTPYYTCSVWGGYDVNTKLSNTSFHMTIWKAVMSRIHENLEYKEFERPDGIVSATICTKCGKLAIEDLCSQDEDGDATRTEIFAEDTAPTDKCDCHITVNICKDSGMIATEFCPNTEKKVIRVNTDSKNEEDNNETDENADVNKNKNTTCNIHTHAGAITPIDPNNPNSANSDPNNPNPGTTNPANPATGSDPASPISDPAVPDTASE